MNLPATTDEVKQQYAPVAQGFRTELEQLQRRPPTQQTRAVAVALDSRAKTFQQQLETARAELKKPILEAGRKLDAFFKAMSDPAAQTRLVCSRIIAQIDAAARKEAAEKAAREAAEALERAKAERAREVEMLVTQAAETNDSALLQAAEEVERAPLVPTIFKAETYQPAASGYSTREVKVGTVLDKYKLVQWLVESPARFEAMLDLIEIPQAKLNAHIRRGVKFPDDAVKVQIDTASRNASRG